MDEYIEIAILNDNVVLLKELLREKPQRLEQRDKYGQTPLIAAVYTARRSIKFIKTLLDAGANVNARNRWGFTALHVVIWNEYFQPESARMEEVVNLLLDNGAAMEDDQNADVATPLMVAVREELCNVARILLARGADPNKFLSKKMSAPYAEMRLLSSAWRHPEMVQVLIQGGADVNLRNASGQTVSEEIQSRDARAFEAEDKKQHSLELLHQAQRRAPSSP